MIGIYKITNLINGNCYIGQSINIKQRWKNHKKDAFWEDGPEYEYPLYKAMRKYGIENFAFDVLEECPQEELNEKEIFYIKKYNTYKGRGYNQSEGGGSQAHSKKLSDKDIDEIIHRLKTTYDSANVICKDFDVGATLIRDINRGDIYKRDNESYPIRQKLYKLPGYLYMMSHQECNPEELEAPIRYLPKSRTCPICGNVKGTKSKQCINCHNNASPSNQKPTAIELAKMVVENGFSAVGRKFGVSGNTIVKWCVGFQIPSHKKELEEWYYSQIGEPVPKRERRKMSDIMKPVRQIELKTMRIISEFGCPADAAKSINDKADATHIAEVCRGKRKSAYGYYWQYADTENT